MKTTYEALPMSSYPVRIQRFVDHRGSRVHWHEEIEILLFTKGTGTVLCDLKELSVKQGEIVMINGNELHTGSINGEGTTYYCIHINTDFFHNLIGNEYVIFEHIINNGECERLLKSVIEKTREGGFKNITAVKRMLYEFFDLIAEKYVSSVLNEAEYKKHFRRLDTFNSVIEYIDLHYDEELSVQSLAKQFYLSASYFSHMFKERGDTSVMEYINEVRISHAKNFLEREALSVGEIACRVGFNDINYFSRRFRATTGMTPSEYRRKCGKA